MVPRDPCMKLICHEGMASGSQNMARDLELLESVRRGDLELAFRTYQWDPWTVSLGKHQRLASINVDEAHQRGFDIVHRPTGGRAVLHAQEITYCIAVRGVPTVVYAAVHQALHSALETYLPDDLTFEQSPTDLRQHYASATPMGQVCFTSSARTEIMAGGRKLVGSAQRLVDGVVLQHGSILLGPGHEQIADLLFLDIPARDMLRQQLASTSVTLSELLGVRMPTTSALVDSILRSINNISVV